MPSKHTTEEPLGIGGQGPHFKTRVSGGELVTSTVWGPREIDIQIFLVNELRARGFDVKAEATLFTPAKERCRVDILVAYRDRNIEIIEVKSPGHPIHDYKYQFTRQYHRYTGLGLPISFIASENATYRILELCRPPEDCLDNYGLVGDIFKSARLGGALRVQPQSPEEYRAW